MGVLVAVLVGVLVGLLVAVAVLVGVLVAVFVGVLVGVFVAVEVFVGGLVGVLLGVGVSATNEVIAKIKPPTKYISLVEPVVMLAVVWPGLVHAETSKVSRSNPPILLAAPVSCGKSPALETGLPKYERVLFIILSVGFCALLTLLPLNSNWSPALELSPS